jgi:hypothetical protein
VRDNTDRSEGIREALEEAIAMAIAIAIAIAIAYLQRQSRTPFSGSVLNAYALHASAVPQVLAKFSLH